MAKRKTAAPTAVPETAAPPIAPGDVMMLPGQGMEPIQLSIDLPVLGELQEGYVSRHVDVRLDGVQAVAVRRLFDALDRERALLRNGSRVKSTADAVRWFLEQIPGEA